MWPERKYLWKWILKVYKTETERSSEKKQLKKEENELNYKEEFTFVNITLEHLNDRKQIFKLL